MMVRNNIWLILGALLVLLCSLAAGFAIDPSNFGSNVLAELAGAVVSIGVAIWVVERLLEQDRRQRWSLVEEQTIRTLRLAIVKGALPLYLHLPAPRPSDADPYMNDGAGRLGDALGNLGKALREHRAEDLRPDPLRDVLRQIGTHMDFIRDVVMQRLLTVAPDPELIRRLTMLDATYEDLDLDAWLEEQFGSRTDQTTQRMAELAVSMSEVAAYLDRLETG
jgi:hypothetical protein